MGVFFLLVNQEISRSRESNGSERRKSASRLAHSHRIKTAEWVIDLGPEGGPDESGFGNNGGGKVVAMGTPEEVAGVEGSWTGRYLRGMLARVR